MFRCPDQGHLVTLGEGEVPLCVFLDGRDAETEHGACGVEAKKTMVSVICKVYNV